MTNQKMTREEEIEAAFKQRDDQNKRDKEAAWEQAEAEQNKGRL